MDAVRRSPTAVTAFNPLDTSPLTKVFVNELISRPPVALPEVDPTEVQGPGLYALYYTGAYDLYRPLAKAGTEWPIYLGSAVPRGSRKGKVKRGGKSPILDRLERHNESVTYAENLDETLFFARWLEVDEPFIILGEMLLNRFYQPLWNATLDGFGNKVVGKERETGKKSQWDTMHPGRPGRGQTEARDPVKIEEQVKAHLAEYPPGFSIVTSGTAHAASDP